MQEIIETIGTGFFNTACFIAGPVVSFWLGRKISEITSEIKEILPSKISKILPFSDIHCMLFSSAFLYSNLIPLPTALKVGSAFMSHTLITSYYYINKRASSALRVGAFSIGAFATYKISNYAKDSTNHPAGLSDSIQSIIGISSGLLLSFMFGKLFFKNTK